MHSFKIRDSGRGGVSGRERWGVRERWLGEERLDVRKREIGVRKRGVGCQEERNGVSGRERWGVGKGERAGCREGRGGVLGRERGRGVGKGDVGCREGRGGWVSGSERWVSGGERWVSGRERWGVGKGEVGCQEGRGGGDRKRGWVSGRESGCQEERGGGGGGVRTNREKKSSSCERMCTATTWKPRWSRVTSARTVMKTWCADVSVLYWSWSGSPGASLSCLKLWRQFVRWRTGLVFINHFQQRTSWARSLLLCTTTCLGPKLDTGDSTEWKNRLCLRPSRWMFLVSKDVSGSPKVTQEKV